MSLCNNHGNETDHLFLFCHTSKIFWSKINYVIGWINNNQNCYSMCEDLCSIITKNRQGIIRFNVVVAALWTIWLEQNNRVFNNKFASNVNIWEDILQVYWPLVLKTSTIFGILSCITWLEILVSSFICIDLVSCEFLCGILLNIIMYFLFLIEHNLKWDNDGVKMMCSPRRDVWMHYWPVLCVYIYIYLFKSYFSCLK